jgi:hypothetical protein
MNSASYFFFYSTDFNFFLFADSTFCVLVGIIGKQNDRWDLKLT